MNNYSLQLNYNSKSSTTIENQLLVLSHFVRNGTNLNFTRSQTPALTSINADFNYSLSNVSQTYLTQHVYSSAHTNTIETEDRPFARQGYLAIVAVTEDSTAHLSDMGDYTKLKLSDINNDAPVPLDIYIGFVNSSQTDFYTPFTERSNVKSVLYFDSKQTSNLKQSNLNFAARKSA